MWTTTRKGTNNNEKTKLMKGNKNHDERRGEERMRNKTTNTK